MKKITIFLTILIVLFFISNKSINADIIMDGYKPVTFCTKITNLNDFNIGIVANSYEIMKSKSLISNDLCLSFYKFSNIDLYWNKNKDLSINQNNILIQNIKHYHSPVKNDDPLNGITEEYKIYKKENGGYGLYLSRRISSYNNRKDKIENFQCKKNTEQNIKHKRKDAEKIISKENTNKISNQTRKNDNIHEDVSFRSKHERKTIWNIFMNFLNNLFK